jgi:hypothetical protein
MMTIVYNRSRAPMRNAGMTTTGSTAPKSRQDDPIKVIFDLASYWATI